MSARPETKEEKLLALLPDPVVRRVIMHLAALQLSARLGEGLEGIGGELKTLVLSTAESARKSHDEYLAIYPPDVREDINLLVKMAIVVMEGAEAAAPTPPHQPGVVARLVRTGKGTHFVPQIATDVP